MPSETPRLLSFYRADPWRRMRRVLLVGPGTLAAGGVVIAVSFLARQALLVRVDAAAAGFLLIAGGAAYTLAGMHRILRDDVVLALRTDGVMVQAGGRDIVIPWDELTAVRWDAPRSALILERSHGEPIVFLRPFARITGRELAEGIAMTKRRVAMKLPTP
jgi:hypothetical protein